MSTAQTRARVSARLGPILALVLAVWTPSLGAQEGEGAGAQQVADLQARLATLGRQLEYLQTRRDIFEATKRYTRGADRHDTELVRSAFWPDATISYGAPMRLDEYVDWEERRLAAYAAHQHHVTGQTIEVDGETAHVESYVIVFLAPGQSAATQLDSSATAKVHVGSGRYVERWHRRNGEWRILVREYVEDLALNGDVVGVCTSTCLGTRDRNDLSYDRPLEHLTREQRQARAESNQQQRDTGDAP